jgi:arylformamidase
MSDWVDLTAVIDENIPVRPLHDKPAFDDLATIEEDGYNSTMIHIETHCGTHMDAPTHFLPNENNRSIHEWQGEEMVGKGAIFDFSHKERGTGVGRAELQTKAGQIGLEEGDFVILKFDLEPEDTDRYLMDYNYVDQSGAEYLVSAGISCVASEALNIEKSGKPVSELTVHHELLGADVFIVEGLVNLDQVEEGRCDVICTPIPYRDRDGSQVRFLVDQS